MEAQRGESSRLGGLDLIRVVAVVAVLLYHADDALPGGLLGVTVFFTLSGYLITGPLWQELRATDRIDLRHFWSRRVRRLVPPSIVTVAAVAVIWPTLGYHLAASDVVGAVLPIRNWTLLGSEAGYGASPSPTSHFWSLAVEEQIYLVLPLAMWGLWRVGRTRAVVIAFGAVTVASLGAAALTAANGSLDRAYLDTSMRLGELVAGAVLAIVTASLPTPGDRVRRVIAAAGVAALVVLCWLFTAVHWPSAAVTTWGIPAAVVASAVACVAASHGSGLLDHWGSRAPVRIVADHAYELYLVHVPVYLVITTYRTALDGPALLAARLSATVLIAAGLHALTEPVRRRRWLRTARSFGLAVAPVAVVLVAVMIVADRPRLGARSASANELPSFVVSGATIPSIATASSIPSTPSIAMAAAVGEAPPELESQPEVATPSDAERPTVWLIGDSTLRELEDPERTATPLSAALDEAGWEVTGFVGIRALALCGERFWDEAGDGQDGRMLPAVRDVGAEWLAIAPARTVVVQLGSNDLTQFSFTDDELRHCVDDFVASFPAETELAWVLPAFGPWCWCDVERAHRDAARFAEVLVSVSVDHPQLRLLVDGLVDTSMSGREVWAEDGVHATRAGRRLRVSALVDQLGEPA